MKLRKVGHSSEHRGSIKVIAKGRNSSLFLVLQTVMWNDAQETTKSLTSPGHWEGRLTTPKYKMYLKSQIIK